MPDNYQTEVVRYVREVQPPPPSRVMVDSLAPSRPVTLPNEPAINQDGTSDAEPLSTFTPSLAVAAATLATAEDTGMEVVV